MAKATCLICKQSGEGSTYEKAAESIDHAKGSRNCPGGPGAKIVYVDSEGKRVTTIPKNVEGKSNKIIVTDEATATKKPKTTKKSNKS